MQSLRSRSLTHIPQVQDGDSAAARLTSPDPHRLDALQRAADSIIREKDMIIEKYVQPTSDISFKEFCRAAESTAGDTLLLFFSLGRARL